MSRLTLFNSPLLLGFDHFERVLDRVSKASTDGYPPYNVEQTGAKPRPPWHASAGQPTSWPATRSRRELVSVRLRQGFGGHSYA